MTAEAPPTRRRAAVTAHRYDGPRRLGAALMRHPTDALQRAIFLGRPEGWRPRPVATEHTEEAEQPGWIEGTFRVDSYEAAVSELLALGTEVEVLLPLELREAMAEVGRAITARHRGRARSVAAVSGAGGGLKWLGVEALDEGRFVLDVVDGVVAGSGALYGGCATAAVVGIGRALCSHTPRWVAVHFTGLARLGDRVSMAARVVSAGRTVTHIAVEATAATSGAAADSRATFSARAAFGDRPPVAEDDAETSRPPAVGGPSDAEPFDLPAHVGTFADRFEWRLAGVPSGHRTACWWVRPVVEQRTRRPSTETSVAVLADYLTYGIGRAAGAMVGGLSVDNVLRLHRSEGAGDGWLLLEIAADALDGGFGSGCARVFDGSGRLLATGSQTMVLNPWDWRRPGELGRAVDGAS